MSWLHKIFTRKVEDNNLKRMLYEMLNSDLPIWIGDDVSEYITKGFVYNDVIYSIIKLKQDITKSIEWLPYKIIDDKAFKGFQYHTKAYKAGINPAQNIIAARKFRAKALEETSDSLPRKIIDNVNENQSIRDVAEEYVGWLDIIGNFYLYANMNDTNKLASSYHVMPAHEVEIIAGNWMSPIKGYKMKNYMGNEIIDKSDILHIKNWNPNYNTNGSHLYGLSPLKAGARILTLDNAGIDTSTSSYQNSGIRGIIHSMIQKDGANNFTPEQADQIKKKIDSWSGTGNFNKIIGTNAPVGYTEIGKSPVDLGVLSAMDKNLVRLCNLFQVPVELFLPGATFNNKKESRKSLITSGILPKLEIFRENINRFIVEPINKYYTSNYYIDYDMFSIVELQDDLESIAAMYKDLDFITINEKREALNYGAFDNEYADDITVDPYKIPLSQVGFDSSFNEIDKEMSKMGIKVYEELGTIK